MSGRRSRGGSKSKRAYAGRGEDRGLGKRRDINDVAGIEAGKKGIWGAGEMACIALIEKSSCVCSVLYFGGDGG